MSLERVGLVVIAIGMIVLAVLALVTDSDPLSERTMDAGQNVVIGMLSLALAFRR